MYEEQIEKLRSCASHICKCEEDVKEGCWDGMMNEAADIIEKLEKEVSAEVNSRRFWHEAFLTQHDKVKKLYHLTHSSTKLTQFDSSFTPAVNMIVSERDRQKTLWGEVTDNTPFEWMSILGEEFGELCLAVNETYFKNPRHPECGGIANIVKEASHVGALCIAIIDAFSGLEGDIM